MFHSYFTIKEPQNDIIQEKESKIMDFNSDISHFLTANMTSNMMMVFETMKIGVLRL